MVPYKTFERDLHHKYDPPARKALRAHLINMGFNVDIGKEDFGVDLKAYRKDTGRLYLHEVEVSTKWKIHSTPPDHWKEFRIPYRKNRLLHKVPPGVTLTFWQLNVIFSCAIWTDSKKMIGRKGQIRDPVWRGPKEGYGPDWFFIFDKSEFNYTTLQLG